MTTTFQTALQSGDYTKLRGATANNSWWARQFITLCKNTVIFQAAVNGNVLSTSFARIPYTAVSVGAYTDIEIGETFFLSHTSNIRDAYYRGRIRKAADGTYIYVNETSVNITSGDIIFVVYDFDIWDVLSRMVSGVQYWDYDIVFHPLAPAIIGLRNAYIQYDPAGSTYRVAFDVSNSFAADQASTSSLSYQFTFVAGTYMVVSGALNTAVVTVDFNTDTEQWGKLVVTDSQGTTKTRRFYIRNHGVNDPPSLDFSGTQITGSIENGWNATVSAWNGVSNVLNQTYTVISTQEYYNGVLGPVSIANNIDMVGRLHREDNHGRGDPTYSYITDVKFDIEGICTQMQRLQEQDLTTIYKTTATKVDEISLNTPQRSILYYCDTHSTVSNLCDIAFPVGFDITYLMQYVPNQGGNVLDAIRGIAAQINASVEFAPDGRIQVVRDTRYLVDKSGVVIVGNFTTADFTTLDLPVDPVNKVGRADGYGISFNAANIAAFRSRAPGNAQSYAAGQATLDNQILLATSHATLAQAELNYRLGQFLNIENLTYQQDWKAATGGYHFLIPSRGQRVTHTLPASTNTRGLAFTVADYWQVVSITINHNNADGSREVTTHEELEPPIGDSGDTVPQIAGGTQTNPITLQPLDPFPALPDDPGNYLPDDPTPNPYPPAIPQKTGGVVIYTTGNIIDTSRNVTTSRTPAWADATPDGLTSAEDVTFDRTTLAPPIGAADVDNDGTNSKFRYTSDAFAIPVVWDAGNNFSGIYSIIRSASTPGSVLAYGLGTAAIYSDNLTTGLGPKTHINSATYGMGVWPPFDTGGTYISTGGRTGGGRMESASSGFHAGFNKDETTLVVDLGADYTVSGASFWHVQASGTDVCTARVRFWDSSKVEITNQGSVLSCSVSWRQFSYSGAPVNNVRYVSFSSEDNFDLTGKTYLDDISVVYGGSSASVIYSSDYGATVNTPATVGATPGLNGAFDILPIGNTTIAAALGQVKIATALGGAYSNAAGGTLASGNPVALVLPIRRFPHGARQDSVSNPDYILGADASNSGATLWLVDGASGTRTNITPVSGAPIAPHCVTSWQTSSIIRVQSIVNDGGTYKLYTYDGSTSTFGRNVSDPKFLRYKRQGNPVLYLIDGSSLYISFNHGATWLLDTTPSSDVGKAMDIYG